MDGRRHILILLLSASLCGCTAVPYRFGGADQYRTSSQLAAITEPQIERGKPRPVIDGIGWVIGIPGKIILWDRRVDNHNISADTENVLAEYLALNELETVKVRVNQYAPFQEWDRLVENKSVGWGWRYTAGTLTWLGYTLFPGRIFGGDHYNAFTNTINLYSDVPAIAVHEGGHAKDFARREWKGTYAVAYGLPGVPLWHEAIATNDALSYFHNEGTLAEEQEAYRILYPAYGTYISSAITSYLPWDGGLVFVGSVVPGHILGRIKANQAAAHRPPDFVEKNRLPAIDDPSPSPDSPLPLQP